MQGQPMLIFRMSDEFNGLIRLKTTKRTLVSQTLQAGSHIILITNSDKLS